ncbi:MAG: hypothetical protein NVSMB56_15050 [Pyrinomonadaceae bacterium]
MGVPFEHAAAQLDKAVSTLFASDSTVRSVGIGLHENKFGYFVVRNSAVIQPLSGIVGVTRNAAKKLPMMVEQIPVVIRDTPQEVESHLKLPFSGPGSPTAASTVIEQNTIRPLCIGLQIENFDDDVRTGEIAKGFIIIGTLGCFVKLKNGATALVSNNHVVAGENHGKKGKDRIMQAGDGTFSVTQHVATLSDFARIKPSPAGASVAAGTAILNLVDAGVAKLTNGVAFNQAYHPSRNLIHPTGITAPKVGDRVFKVGRTTGLTQGEIKSVATVVGPVGYRDGESWFKQSFVIEGLNGTMFSDHGDSGSAIVTTSGEIVGLLYAGNGAQTYACPIDEVFKKMKCTLA